MTLNVEPDGKHWEEGRVPSGDTASDIPSDPEAERIAFLSSFSAEEDRAIRRKVDWRFLWLIGMMYIIKNVRLHIYGS